MFCKYCGKQIENHSKFCIFCGMSIKTYEDLDNSKIEKDGAGLKEPSGSIVKESIQPGSKKTAQPEIKDFGKLPEKKAKKGKRLFILSASLCFLVLVGGLCFFFIGKVKNDNYKKASKLMEKKEYLNAGKIFEDLKEFKDSKSLAEECRKNLDYEKAESFLQKEKFKEAKEVFEKLEDFKDSEKKAKQCNDELEYILAVELKNGELYEEAALKFAELNDFKDSASMAQYCRNKLDYDRAEAFLAANDYRSAKEIYAILQDFFFEDSVDKYWFCLNKETFERAEKNFEKGRYYRAYSLFSGLGNFEGADQRMKECIQSFPGNKELYRNKEFKNNSVSLNIVPPADNSRNIIKIYDQNDKKVSLITIDKNSRYTVRLPAGSYKIKNGYGYDEHKWFGKKDLFGEEGYYCSLTNTDYKNEIFTMEKGYAYTLTLRSDTEVKGKKVQTKKESFDNF